MSDREDPLGEVLAEGPSLSYAAIACTLELSRIRSLMMVGMALVDTYPTESKWWELLSDPEYIESLNALAEIINDIRTDATLFHSADSPDAMAIAIDRHHERAVESIEVISTRLSIPPEDLLSVLINA